jgi:hypothetical protein
VAVPERQGVHERTHAHTCLYDFLSADYADDNGVPVKLALDHSYEGLGVVFVEPVSGNSRDDLQEWLTRAGEAVPSLLGTGVVSTVSTWAMHPRPEPNPAQRAPMSLGADGGGDDRLIQLCFLESDPQSGWEAFRQYGNAVDSGGVGRVTFAAPFLPTVLGTDRYTDQLW